MKSKVFYTLFSIVLVLYALLYIATSKDLPCEDDCLKLESVNTILRQKSYVRSAYNCSQKVLCVNVIDTTGINWQLLADTSCTVLKSKSLTDYRVVVLKYSLSSVDTLANKTCN